MGHIFLLILDRNTPSNTKQEKWMNFYDCEQTRDSPKQQNDMVVALNQVAKGEKYAGRLLNK
jgi:hypothetical protein